MLALSRTCKALHVASYELVRREEVLLPPAWRQRPLVPYSSHLIGTRLDDDSDAAKRTPGQMVAYRRKARHLSLLLGSPEVAAAKMSQLGNGWGIKGMKAVEIGEKWDCIADYGKLFAAVRARSLHLCQSSFGDDPYECTLFYLNPDKVPSFMKRIASAPTRDAEHASSMSRLQEVATKAVEEGEALCLLHTLW